MSVWVLIIFFNWGYKSGAALDHVPFATEEACQLAVAKILGTKTDGHQGKWAFCVLTGAKVL